MKKPVIYTILKGLFALACAFGAINGFILSESTEELSFSFAIFIISGISLIIVILTEGDLKNFGIDKTQDHD
jgi:predicted outer membrane lipoprotein